MFGFVIVSHSEKVAEGIKDVVEQLHGGKSVCVAAGGVDGRIGTNPLKIQEAIETVQNCEHILVFVDLGSAVLSTDLAIDLLEDDLRQKVMMVDGPILEGAVIGVIQASITDDLAEVLEMIKKSKELVKFSE
ncbi:MULTISPECIES: dihydroxyacetone kinase phosphoryl donor subunit DhaM [Pelosinus]|uniref:phosphoenolpyruvate--glycerone phosphotransferase n=1 Tax=Pelosinus fermentans B4 TaxID=1149862 RepID=I9LGE3_9FIRM|nr:MULTISPECIES: dihydroxyacetone kinase phosphoryl donor subunit DhaM [Pelosinus]EIW19426.1 dihydroxyacetone kinase, phosphotransfer subunit [Pelosinus fermentans B4]EIW24842.1 dihydroxyacetone kinase, phosphotransfer subunit [Pelosinus fermentans A11]OAM96110.1 dihydroxyacetone kinase, phosphotransfer subunit [Pelosinus fermentans DSM 17108]SDR36458.1 dihydroxyacetone kinase, phosphotransfer subunit [Pelosinus fermentans]